MPLYEYQCEACGQRFEIIQRFSDGPPEACRLCGKGPVQRLHSSPAIQFKGTGWYITDYAQKGKSGSTEGGSSEKKTESKETKDGASSTSTSSDTKSETKASPAPAATPAKSE
jgi:putative FmdB family regulatory protein